jgi:integrase
MTKPKGRTRRPTGAVRKLPSGRYQARLRDPLNNRLVPLGTYATKADADAAIADGVASQRRGVWVDPRKSRMTFGTWAQHWLESDATTRPRTHLRYEQIVNGHLVPALGDAALGAITPLDVQRLVGAWTKAYAPNTVRHHYAVLRAILNAALDADLIGRSPCRGVKLPSVEQSEHHIVTADELARLALELGDRYRALAYTAAMLGLRFGELAGLRVGRLDLLRGTVTVAESLGEARGELVSGPPKSAAGRRTLSIPRSLASMLSEHLSRQGTTGADPGAFVFAAPGGGPLRYSNFRSLVWAPACRRAGLEGLQLHDLRRAAATAMVASGVDVRTAQARLGHSDPRLTIGLYAQATNDGDRAAAERLEEHFMAATSQTPAVACQTP